jgi:beta-lactamase regulating signal transducer with metallopeptidase domain
MNSQWVLTFLSNALWQPLVITSSALACDRLMRNFPARQRHNLWVAAMTLCVLLPLLSASGLLRNKEAQPSTPGNVILIQAETNDSIPSPAPSALGGFFRSRSQTFSPSPGLVILTLVCFLISLLLHVAKLWRAGKETKALLAGSYRREIPERLALIKRQCQRALGLKGVTLLFSSQTTAPITAGRRSIILPETLFDSATPDLLSAAMGHEMAHIKRRDFAFNLCYQLLSMPLAFHPAVVFIKRRINETRELACDEMVTERWLDAPDYARALLRLAESAMVWRRGAYSLGVFEADILEERIMKLIERKPRLSKRVRTIILALVLSLVSASTAVATVFSINIAQDGNSSGGAGDVARTAPKQSGNTSLDKIVGEWVVIVSSNDGTEPEAGRSPMIVNADGNRLTGKVIIKTDDGQKDWVLIEPKFDGETFTFKVDNGEELLAGDLKLKNDQFEGTWQASISGLSGRLKLVRKKIENTK